MLDGFQTLLLIWAHYLIQENRAAPAYIRVKEVMCMSLEQCKWIAFISYPKRSFDFLVPNKRKSFQ